MESSLPLGVCNKSVFSTVIQGRFGINVGTEQKGVSQHNLDNPSRCPGKLPEVEKLKYIYEKW